MIKWVIKRDGRKVRLKADKIKYAVWKSYEDLKLNAVESELDELANKVASELNDAFDGNIHVDVIQSAVERNLMLLNPNVAKNYILYRNERNRQRTIESDLIKSIKKIKNTELKSNNVVRDNANENGQTPAGQYGKVGSEMQKTYNLLNNIDKRFAEQHTEGYQHIHDLNFYDLSFNCLFAPVGKLLKTGFDSGTGFLRPPKSINTAAYLTSVILQLQSNQQFGGIASDNIDFDLAPYVDLSFKKNLKTELERFYSYGKHLSIWEQIKIRIKSLFGIKSKIKMPEIDLSETTLNQGEDYLLDKFPVKPVKFAIKQTDRDTYQAMEGLVANLNSLQSRSGNQVPFSSLNFGLDTSICGRMLSKNLIKAQMAGLGDGLTAIFPILIFKLMKGVTFNSNDPNYDLYLDSIRCLARRFYPNFVGVDNKFNAKYIKYEEKTFIFKYGPIVLHRIGTNNNITLDLGNAPYIVDSYELNEYELVESNGITWQIQDIIINQFSDLVIKTRRLMPETTVATMGCASGDETIVIEDLGKCNFYEYWNKCLSMYEKKVYSNHSYYFDLSDKNVNIYDEGSNSFVKCIKVIKNINAVNWTRVTFSNGKSLKLTPSHPLYLESGRTEVKDIKLGSLIKCNGELVSVTNIEYIVNTEDSYDVETESDRFQLSGFNSGNCRTRVIGNKNGPEQTTGRGNLAFHTLNLPKLAIQAHIESKDPVERKKIFFKKLQSLLEDAKQSLIDRYNLIAKKTYENFPFTMQQGLYLTSDDKQHKVTDTIGEVLKQGTLSIGYIGIYETLLLLTGKVWGKDKEIKPYGIEIVKYIHDFCKKCEKETEFNWSCFATPAESVAGRFCNIDKNEFSNDPRVKSELFDELTMSTDSTELSLRSLSNGEIIKVTESELLLNKSKYINNYEYKYEGTYYILDDVSR